MDCNTLYLYVSAYVDGELDQTVTKDIENHLAVCRKCQAVVQTELRFKKLFVSSYQPEKAPGMLRSKIRNDLNAKNKNAWYYNNSQKMSGVMEKSLQLRIYPDAILREICALVTNIDGEIRKLIDGMTVIMYSYNGIGLASPQVGFLKRMFIADTGDNLIFLANPEIINSDGEALLEEGCLSLPDIQVNVKRSFSVFVRGINADGKEIEREFSGLTARVIQHEIDHLNGVLIIDQASLAEKYQLRKALKALEKQYKNSNINQT